MFRFIIYILQQVSVRNYIDKMMIVKLKFRQQKTLTKQGSIKIRFKTNYLIASFNALPDTNAGTLDAAILISAPVCGLRPVRAAR